MAEFQDTMIAVGRALGAAGAFVGRKVADGYRAIDPDVGRHVAQIPLLASTLLGARAAEVEAAPDDGHPPLVFVHGLGGSRGDFLLMSWYLATLGRKRSYRVAFDTGASIEERGAWLATYLREVLAVNDADQVDVVAHSLGGVAARVALTDPDIASRVRVLITLGSPHGGTYPARYGNTETLRELRPDSQLVARLKSAGWPEGVRGVTFWSRADLFVLPPESAAVEGTERIELTPFTHYSYLISPKSWVAVARALNPCP